MYWIEVTRYEDDYPMSIQVSQIVCITKGSHGSILRLAGGSLLALSESREEVMQKIKESTTCLLSIFASILYKAFKEESDGLDPYGSKEV